VRAAKVTGRIQEAGGRRQGQEADGRSRRQEAGGRRQEQEQEAGGRVQGSRLRSKVSGLSRQKHCSFLIFHLRKPKRCSPRKARYAMRKIKLLNLKKNEL
jgi:hypothetical protein